MCAVRLVRGGGGGRLVRANFGRIARRPPPTVHSTPVTPMARRGGRWLAAAVSRPHTLQAGGGRRAGGASGSRPAGGGAAAPPESTSDSTPRPPRSLYTRSVTGDRRRGLVYQALALSIGSAVTSGHPAPSCSASLSRPFSPRSCPARSHSHTLCAVHLHPHPPPWPTRRTCPRGRLSALTWAPPTRAWASGRMYVCALARERV